MKCASFLLNYLYVKSFSEKAACVASSLLFTIQFRKEFQLLKGSGTRPAASMLVYYFYVVSECLAHISKASPCLDVRISYPQICIFYFSQQQDLHRSQILDFVVIPKRMLKKHIFHTSFPAFSQQTFSQLITLTFSATYASGQSGVLHVA